ncbi:hypothetical protein AUK10_04120 [Candidatus Gracilibacteria bacterium CG2_30_37_12]|nr:MAG: hypothetical protein AUK10_04120 [Candidatus Gracilibacteria bacterium CG2_30_37_12]
MKIMEKNNTDETLSIHSMLGSIQGNTAGFATMLTKEYDCQTSLEISLCEIIANSFKRIISVSKLMETDLNLNYPSKEKVNYLAILSKELDRQNRNYLTAINTLIDMKNPKMTINVNTENTFLGENQQFNNNQGKNENIKD